MNTTDFTKRQERLDKRKNPVKIRDVESVTDLAEVIYKLIAQRNSHLDPLTRDTIIPALGNRIQCHGGSARSIDDIYIVAKSYIPGITLKQVDAAISKLKGPTIGGWYCYDVKKRVHRSNYGKTIQDFRNSMAETNIKNAVNVKSSTKDKPK